MKFFYSITLIMAMLFLVIAGCSEDEVIEPPPQEEPDNHGFISADVANVFVNNCASDGCHSGANAVNGLSMENHSKLLMGASDRPGYQNYGGEVVIPFNPEKSLLYQVITGQVNNMSVEHSILDSNDIITVKDWISRGALDEDGNVPFSNPSYRAFICNQKSDVVSVIDGDAKVVSRIIDADFLNINEAPHMVKVRDGYLYVTLIATGKFLKYDLSDYSLVGEVSGIEKAGMIMIKPDGQTAYVSRSTSSDPIYNTVYEIDIQNMALLDTVNLPADGIPHGIALTPDGKKLFISNLTRSRVEVVNAENNEYEDGITFHISSEPTQTTVSPDGQFLYVSDFTRNLIIVIDAQTNTILQEIPVKEKPMHIAINSTGDKIFVPTLGGNSVEVIIKTGNSWSVEQSITHPAFSMMHGCEITPDDNYVYVSGRNLDGTFVSAYPVDGEETRGIVAIINTQSYDVEKILEIERHGAGLTVAN